MHSSASSEYIGFRKCTEMQETSGDRASPRRGHTPAPRHTPGRLVRCQPAEAYEVADGCPATEWLA